MKALRILVMILVVVLAAGSNTTNAQTLTVLHSFSGSDGSNPDGGLVQGSDGNFYGTTFDGGAHNTGTVFRISPTGSFTNLYSFTGGIDGALPQTVLIQGNDGNFYGTTSKGGTTNAGTVFQITPTGSLTTLHSFTDFNGNGDSGPTALVQGSD